MATRYLICNTPASVMKKHKKAVSMGMRIITEAEFFEMFGRP